jgi:predicted esterase
MRFRLHAAATAALALLVIQAVAQEVDPQKIDPYEATAGDFLDIDVDALARQGREAYDAKEYEKAARYYLAALRHDTRNATDIYNLACCYGLLGKDELAAKYLERAVKAGFTDLGHIKGDPDFDKVREKAAFTAAMARIEERLKARETGAEVVHLQAPAFMKCLVHLPEGYDPDRSYTLLVGLHGLGGRADSFSSLWRYFKDEGLIYAVPETPYAFGAGTQVGYSWTPREEASEEVFGQAREATEQYVVDVVRELKARYNVGEVYLFGFSQGCFLTYCVGLKHPGDFDGVVCFGGWLDEEWIGDSQLARAKGLRAFIAHGQGDNIVEYEGGTHARDRLIENGNDVTFLGFDGGHQVPEEAVRKAIEWMKG